MKVVEYGDPTTKAKFSSVTTLGLICQFGPNSAPALKEISQKFSFQNLKLMVFSAAEANTFGKIVKG